MEYLPEWKIYLWEKLLLDKRDSNDTRKISDFIFFDRKDLIQAYTHRTEKEIDSITDAFADAHEKSDTDTNWILGVPINELYFSDEKPILMAIIELATERPRVLEITKINIDRSYIAKYKHRRGTYLAQEERKRVASISIGSGPGRGPDQNYFNNRFCGLGEDIFNKINAGQELTIDDLNKLLPYPVDFLWECLSFKVKVGKKALLEKLYAYVHHFMLGELTPPPKARYYSYEQQQEKISASIELLAKKYGDKHISITLRELAVAGGWYHGEDWYFRFYENLFALSMTGKIIIHDLRKEEVVISLTDEFEKEEDKRKKETGFDLEKEKGKIAAIKSEVDFKTIREKWFPVKVILDIIHRKLPPLEDIDGIITEPITIDPKSLTPEQIKILPFVMKHASDNGAISIFRSGPKKQSEAVVTSELAEKLLAGENIAVEDLDRFDDYRGKMNELCDFIDKEEKTKFPKAKAEPAASLLSDADKKRLCILEKLKAEWELVPKQSIGPTMLQAGLVIYKQQGPER